MSTRFTGNLVNDTQIKVDRLKTARDKAQRRVETRADSAAMDYLIKRKEALDSKVTDAETELSNLKDRLALKMD
ncbi:hypothetical protein [Alkalicoccus luteus]|uniref:Uncharacterized protein n=1 Tax=Alkalicoccus luteus TaxID=1237094 RepID=A0A969PXR3_9BACI|nr:hypothetical protein [Alkalicoccus luteus]NJP39379.1 hypothetical protein [Alkalicoccus luteus]